MIKIQIFDSHAHLDREEFEPDRENVIKRLMAGVFPGGLPPAELDGYEIEFAGAVVPAVDAASALRIIELSKQYPNFLFPAVGIHPNHSHLTAEGDWQTITELANRGNVVAVGETGLDRYWDDAPLETQIESLLRHFELARQTQKPILIHCRDAWDDFLPLLREQKSIKGIIHAFSGTAEQALECVDLGWLISYAGSLTYRNAKFAPLWESAKVVPLDRLLIETDSPFLTPHPLRGKLQRNEPPLSAMVAKRLAELRGEPLETIAEAVMKNTEKTFSIPFVLSAR